MRAILMLVLALVLAGCTTDESPASLDQTVEETSTEDDPLPEASANATTEAETEEEGQDPGATTEGNETLAAAIEAFQPDVTEGDAPLDVTFTVNASSDDPDASWNLSFGDGETTEGMVADLPADIAHTYAAGEFEAVLTLVHAEGELQESVVIVATEVEPPETHFEFGSALGCVTETGHCVGSELGEDGIDGYWLELDERYWGSEVLGDASGNGDTDCWFYDADGAVIANGHNGGGHCTATVPEGTASMFFFPWVAPVTGMALDFTLA